MLSNQTKKLIEQISCLKQQLESASNYAIELESELALIKGCSVEELREEYDVQFIEE
jgi:hypothetical protein